MSRDEIVDKVIEMLRMSKESGRSIHQESLKGRLFEFFADAYNSGLTNSLNAHELADAISNEAPELVGDSVLQDACTFWRDWTYAWDRQSQRW